jgi:hypothetical protein
MFARWHEVGVVCHAGVIIGFPNDTYQRVMEDVRSLAETMLVDQASFFMLTPLPGSQDHQAAVQSGAALDADYNNYDSCHAAQSHPRMSRAEWARAYRDAWTEFYSFAHMRRVLLAQNPHTYWPVLKTLLWYRAGMIEGAHPMVTGFFRLKDRTSRRAIFPIEHRWPFARRRAAEIAHALREYLKLYFEMQELWLVTRIRRDDYWFLGDLGTLGPRSVREVKLAWGRVHAAVDTGLATLQERLGSGVNGLSATMAARIDIVRDTLGGRAPALPSPTGVPAARTGGPGDVASGVAEGREADRLDAVRAALAALGLPDLRPAPAASWLARRIKRVNPLSLDRIEYNPALVAYWRSARQVMGRLEWWRLNPLELAWNLGCGVRQTLAFLVAMRGERY